MCASPHLWHSCVLGCGVYVVSKVTNSAKGIIGHREGGDPENELDNFYKCAECDQSVDMRDLGQVFHHEEDGHEKIDFDS